MLAGAVGGRHHTAQRDADVTVAGPACELSADPLALQDGVWTAPLLIGCTSTSPLQTWNVTQAISLTASPWGAGTWLQGGLRNVSMSLAHTLVSSEPPVVGAPASTLVGQGSAWSIVFAMEHAPDEAVWEVVSATLLEPGVCWHG